MTLDLNFLSFAGFAALTVAAAVVDFQRLIIPNRLIVALFVLWPLHIASARATEMASALESVAGAFFVFAAGALLFARGFVGGGDVKLFAVVSLWAGARAVPALLLLTALIGGALALAYLISSGASLKRAARQTPTDAAALRAGQIPVPYGAAIAAAALIITIAPHLS